MKASPLRVIEGNTKPYEPFWNVIDAAASESGETEIEFYGPISEYSWWGDEISPKAFKDDLYGKGKGGPVRIKINSPGGEVFAANAIRSMLQDYPGQVTADIVALAASAATIVATGADHVIMREGALFMIHNPSTFGYGNSEDLRKIADYLETVKEGILNQYVSRTKKDRQVISDLMDQESWMSANDALNFGFVDEIIEGIKAKSSSNQISIPKNLQPGFISCMNAFNVIPQSIRDLTIIEQEQITDVPESESSSGPDPDANAHELKRLGDYLEIFG